MTALVDHDSERELPLGNQHVEDLRRFRDTYAGRRTVAHKMLEEAIHLSRRAVAEERRVGEAAVARVDAERERALQSADHYRDLWEHSHAIVQRYQGSKPTTLNVLGRDDAVSVVIAKPLGGWTLAKFEDACYQLRYAGGADDLAIDVRSHDLVAELPEAILALSSLRPEPPARVTIVEDRAAPLAGRQGWFQPYAPALVGFWLAVVVALGLWVVLA